MTGSERPPGPMASSGEGDRRRRAAAVLPLLACLLFLGIAISPILGATNLAVMDYPNHLARYYIELTLADDPVLAANYRLEPLIQAYWGGELLIKLLAAFLPLETAGRLMVALAMAAPVLGFLFLDHHVHGRFRWWTLLSVTCLHNLAITLGFTNFLLSTGLLFLCFTLWLKGANWPRRWRVPVFTLMVGLLAFSHLLVAGIFAALMLAYECGRDRGWTVAGLRVFLPRLPELGIILAPIAVVFFVITATETMTYSWDFGGLLSRLHVVLAPFAQYPPFHVATGTWLFFCAFLVAVLSRSLRLTRPYGFPLLGLGLLALAMPAIMQGVHLAQVRVPLVLFLVSLVAIRPTKLPRLGAICLVAASIIVFAQNHTHFAKTVQRMDDNVAELRQAGQLIARGARVLPVVNEGIGVGHDPELRRLNFHYTAHYLVLDRQVFIPSFFPMYRLQPAHAIDHLKPELKDTAGPLFFVEPERHPQWRNWNCDFDYVFLFDLGRPIATPDGLNIIYASDLYRIAKTDRGDSRTCDRTAF